MRYLTLLLLICATAPITASSPKLYSLHDTSAQSPLASIPMEILTQDKKAKEPPAQKVKTTQKIWKKCLEYTLIATQKIIFLAGVGIALPTIFSHNSLIKSSFFLLILLFKISSERASLEEKLNPPPPKKNDDASSIPNNTVLLMLAMPFVYPVILLDGVHISFEKGLNKSFFLASVFSLLLLPSEKYRKKAPNSPTKRKVVKIEKVLFSTLSILGISYMVFKIIRKDEPIHIELFVISALLKILGGALFTPLPPAYIQDKHETDIEPPKKTP